MVGDYITFFFRRQNNDEITGYGKINSIMGYTAIVEPDKITERLLKNINEKLDEVLKCQEKGEDEERKDD